jgi:hypothetical protein
MFRNKEARRFAFIFAAIGVVLTAAGFFAAFEAGIAVLICCAVFGAAFALFTRARYRNLAALSGVIDSVLHSVDLHELGGFDDFNEGELSILHSDIRKLTLRIREQNSILLKDKQYLADSLADIAHQLRTPLTSANLVLVLMEDVPDSAAGERVRELEGLLMQMDWLITALLKIARLESGVVEFRSERLLLGDLVKTALRPLAIPLELRGVEVSVNLPESAAVVGDLNWLSEAFANIFKNCIDAVSADGGAGGRIDISGTDNALYTEIVIRDNGAGFTAEDLPRVFERFYTGSGAKSGSCGIGLALARMIVVRLGGSLTAKNHAAGGAVFALRFPK